MIYLQIPTEHIIINKGDHETAEDLKYYIQKSLGVPNTFNTSVSVVFGGGMPNITGIKMDEDINHFAAYLQAFWDIPLKDKIPSLIMYYEPEKDMLTTVIGDLETVSPLPEGTFMSQQSGQV